MAVFEIIYREPTYGGGRVTKVQAYSYTFTPNQEWIEFWDDGALRAKLAVKAYEVLSVQVLDDEDDAAEV